MDLHSTIRRILKEETQEPKILRFPSLEFFDEDREVAWNIIQKILERKGNPPYSIEGDLDLGRTPIESLGNLQSVGGSLNLYDTPIKSLGSLQSVGGNLFLYVTPIESLGNLVSVGGGLNLEYSLIESLGNLTSVGGDLDLGRTPIKSLGNLQSVGGYLVLRNTPISRKYSEEEIRQMVNVDGEIYFSK